MSGRLLGPVTWTLNGCCVPSGLSFAAGLISGTPTTSGFSNINFSLFDGTDTIYRSINVNVYDVQITTNGTLPNATQGAAYSTLIEASGGTGGHTFTANFLPFGLILDSGGTLHGTANFTGSSVFDVVATDSMGLFYTKRMSVTGVGVPPRVSQLRPYGGAMYECSLGNPCQTGISVFSGGTAPFTWTATGLPPGMDIRYGDGNTAYWVAPGDLEIWGTPQQAGIFNVTFGVTGADGKKSSNTFPLKVSELYQQDYLFGGSYGVPYSRTMRVLGGSSSYTAAIISGRLPLGLTLHPATLVVDGTPLKNGSFNVLVEFTDTEGRTLRQGQGGFIGSLTSTININQKTRIWRKKRFGWETGIRTPITCSRGRCPTVERSPSTGWCPKRDSNLQLYLGLPSAARRTLVAQHSSLRRGEACATGRMLVRPERPGIPAVLAGAPRHGRDPEAPEPRTDRGSPCGRSRPPASRESDRRP